MPFSFPGAEIQIHRILNRTARTMWECLAGRRLQKLRREGRFGFMVSSGKPQLNISGYHEARTSDGSRVAYESSVEREGPILSDQEIEFFREQGFLSRPLPIAREELANIKGTLEDLFKTRAGENEGAYTQKINSSGNMNSVTASEILNPVNYAPSLRKTKCFQNALKIAKQLLGNQAFCFFDFAVLKKPSVGVATPWHQDEAFRDPQFESNEVTVWVPLQDVDVYNGCMQFVPGSQRAGVLRHDSPNHDLSSTALECVDSFDHTTAVPCPLPAGGCTIHHPRTLHGTGPNLSDAPRLAYIMVFTLPLKLTNKSQNFVWLEQKRVVASSRKRRWMRRGGLFITVWRRMRRGELIKNSALSYAVKRTSRILRKAP